MAPIGTCGEYGSTLEQVKAFASTDRMLNSIFDAELTSVVHELLSTYDADASLNDGAKAAVAAMFPPGSEDCLRVRPPLHPGTYDIRWCGKGTLAQAERLASVHLTSAAGSQAVSIASDAWSDLHKPTNVADVPKLGFVPPIVSPCWRYDLCLCTKHGIRVDMFLHRWESLTKSLFPPASVLRASLGDCWIVVAFVRVDLPHAEGVDVVAAPPADDDFVFLLINTHSFGPWSAHFQRCLVEVDPRDVGSSVVQVDVYDEQSDKYKLFDTMSAFASLDLSRWSVIYYKLIADDAPLGSIQPDLQHARRLFEDDAINGEYVFWDGAPTELELDKFMKSLGIALRTPCSHHIRMIAYALAHQGLLFSFARPENGVMHTVGV
jgi:hypothetical protein